MTIAEQLRQEGRQEGREEGLREGQDGLRSAIASALTIRHGSCPEHLVQALFEVTEIQRLRTFLEIALRSHSLEEFSRSL